MASVASDTPGEPLRLTLVTACGARLGWLVDPYDRRVYVYRPGEAVVQLDDPAEVAADPVLPGFVLRLAAIW